MLIALLAPLVYLLVIWNTLPANVPLHYTINGNVDRYGSRNELWVLAGVISFASLLVYLLLTNIHRIDPRRSAAENRERLRKIALAVMVFLAAIQIWLLYIVSKGEALPYMKFVLVAVCFLFAVIGNYMPNLKPNYFAGLRLPWTLENEDNWRRTHQYAGKFWFGGGILGALLCLLLPVKIAGIALFFLLLIIILIPAVYSYRLFKNSK